MNTVKKENALLDYILERIQDDERNIQTIPELLEIIRAEVGHMEAQDGTLAMVEHWLRGMGGACMFTTFDIANFMNLCGYYGSDTKLDNEYRATMAKIIVREGGNL